jgi:predicted NodU family carbamoyl transferase
MYILTTKNILFQYRYRPLAPSVLAEFAGDWFDDLQNNKNESPYMSITTTVRQDKAHLIPAICHIGI